MVNGKQLLLTRSLTEQHQLPEHITLRLKCTRRRLIPTIPVTIKSTKAPTKSFTIRKLSQTLSSPFQTYITVHVRIVQLLQQIIMPRVVTISEVGFVEAMSKFGIS